jgi:uncharacterized protein involved in type VI secretion and phage assembly
MAKEPQPSKQPDDTRLRVSKPIRRVIPVGKFPIKGQRQTEPAELPPIHGALLARVISQADPQGESRVQIQIDAEKDGDAREMWARIVAAGAGDSRGVSFLPEIGDEVAVVFEEGDPRRPLLLGGLWSSADPPPDEVEGDRRSIVTRSGIRIEFEDDDVALTISTPGGNTVRLRDAEGDCTIGDANGNTIRLDSNGITIESSNAIDLSAGGTVNITAAQISADVGMTVFSGVLQSDTLIANSVVASSYTPGAGNLA